MPQNYWGINKGESLGSVTDTTATTAGADVELRYDLDSTMSRLEVLQALEVIKAYVASEDSWPPI